jgi:hypothetical protein
VFGSHEIQNALGRGNGRARELLAFAVEEEKFRGIVVGVLLEGLVPHGLRPIGQFQGDKARDGKNPVARGRIQERSQLDTVFNSGEDGDDHAEQQHVQEGEQDDLDGDGGAKFHAKSTPGLRII